MSHLNKLLNGICDRFALAREHIEVLIVDELKKENAKLKEELRKLEDELDYLKTVQYGPTKNEQKPDSLCAAKP